MVLDIPMLSTLTISCTIVDIGDQSKALSTLTGLPVLTKINIDCAGITSIPPSFPSNLTNLQILYLTGLTTLDIPSTLFQNNYTSLYTIHSTNMKTISFPNNSSANINTLIITLPNSNFAFKLPDNSFTSIGQLTINCGSGSYVIQALNKITKLSLLGQSATITSFLIPKVSILECSTNFPNPFSLTPDMTGPDLEMYLGPINTQSFINLNLTAPVSKLTVSNSNLILTELPLNITQLQIISPTTSNPIGPSLSNFPKLTTLVFSSVYQQILFPLPNLKTLQMNYLTVLMVFLPTTSDLPNDLDSFSVQHSSSISRYAPIPDYKFATASRASSFSVRNLTNLGGSVPESFCTSVYSLDISLTSVSQVPECFKCKWAIPYPTFIVYLSNSTTPSPTSYCNQTFNPHSSLVYTQPGDKGVKLTGTALGHAWTTASPRLTMITANTEFNYTLLNTELVNRQASINFGNL